MKNTLLICCLLLSFYGNAQLKLSKCWDNGEEHLLVENKRLYSTPKKVFFKDSKGYYEVIRWHPNGSLKTYVTGQEKIKYKIIANYNYDKYGNLIHSVIINTDLKEDTLWMKEKCCLRFKDTLIYAEFQHRKKDFLITSLVFEFFQNAQKQRIIHRFHNKFYSVYKPKIDGFDLLQKLRNKDSLQVYFSKGFVALSDSIVIDYDEYCKPRESCCFINDYRANRKNKYACAKFSYKEGFPLNYYYFNYLDNQHNGNNKFLLDQDNEIIFETIDFNALYGNNLNTVKIRNIHRDKYGNWRKREYYDETQKKWITQHRKIKYW